MEQYSKELAKEADQDRLADALLKRADNIAEAIKALEGLVERGSVMALVCLGDIYCYGRRGVPADEPKGEEMLARSSSLGSIEGAYRHAHFLDYTDREAEAFEIYESLARKRFSPAIYRLAWAYHEGRWVTQDKAKARKLFHDAYREGHLLAHQMLSYELRQSRRLGEKLKGYYLLVTLVFPKVRQSLRDPLSDRLRD